ncbi:MarR family winged helix-turn-helix transcriptional regulator [Cellulomonas cellasea]|uniref:DNA-binding MarR family transcriptional regulator n=1 Tax=Cellulomonas cellasea TaxID=43670 RepID=A0A7W4UHL5_9CELL|nr:MarR family winged helix-turn-helix transcriptional regulator [Cellulomonas cellasea]MBB2924315.1 DNA-binding MarR family transcriptional regulator [Cellulomonas cellasea]
METTTGADGGRLGHDELGWTLGVLLRHYQETVGPVLDAVPHRHRGFQVLASVVHGDQRSQLALAGHLGIDRTVMTYLVDDLVAAGLVERQVDPTDRRQRRLVATADGRTTLARLEADVRTAEDAALQVLPPADRATLRHLLSAAACAVRGITPARDVCAAVEDEVGLTAR